MKTGKYQSAATAHNSAKILALMLALILVVGSVAGGTYAWLIANTNEVTNTFTYGDINIDLEETDTEKDDDDDPDTNDYEMMPGEDITKDPSVIVKAGSEDNWLFVKLEKNGGAAVDGTTYDFDDYLTYTIADGWTQLYDEDGKEVEGVYYRFQSEIEDEARDVSWDVLKDNTVTVLETVTKEMLNALDSEDTATYPTLTITAYAVQYVGFEPEISEGAESPTTKQVNAAALKAWNVAQEEA